MTPPLPAAPEYVEPAPEWGRLDPRMIVVRPLNELVGLLLPLFALVFVGDVNLVRTLSGAGAVAFVVLYGLLSWLTTKYRITDTQVELHKGVLFRQRLAIPRDRIRTVDLTAKLGHRLFGLAAVRVGTGKQERGGGEGVVLDAVTAAEADRLRQVFLHRRAGAPEVGAGDAAEDAADDGAPIAALSGSWYRYAPLSLSGLIGVGASVGFLMNLANELDLEFSEVGVLRSVYTWFAESGPATIVPVTAVATVVLAALASLLGYLLQNHRYRLTRQADRTLRVRRGLLTTRSVSIEEDRLRGVDLHEPLLLRAGRGARLSAVTTGLGRMSGSALLLPPAPRAEAHRVAVEVLGARVDVPLRPHPPRALVRRLVRAVVPTVAVAVVLLGLALLADWPHWPWVVVAVLVPVAALVGYDRYRGLGHALTERYLVSRSGSLDRSTVALQRTGIVGWKISRTLFQRRAGVLTITAVTAAGSGGYRVLDVGEAQGLALADAAVPDLLAQFLEHRAAGS
ncbi:PH domain-containing protein [Actinokineospora sp. PR83]|uniref:PH domain-containing protein n=1 Tax=Actinokineospora sp. PR83 TaxID=2884908 RepID=UPI0027DEDC0E|nr:PH domain-containing protein [Actinokineospora sp. PR83]